MWLIVLIATHLFAYGDAQFQGSGDPEPYSFSYIAEGYDGKSAREESSDGSGTVKGFYRILGADGIQRLVNYIADENGFRASIQTNEPGTESKSPANVNFESSQPSGEEIALKYGSRPQFEKSEGHFDTYSGRDYGNLENIKALPKAIGQHPYPSFTSSHKSFEDKSYETPNLKKTFITPFEGYNQKGMSGFKSSVSHYAGKTNLETFKPLTKTIMREFTPQYKEPTKTFIPQYKEPTKTLMREFTPQYKEPSKTFEAPVKGNTYPSLIKMPLIKALPIPIPPLPELKEIPEYTPQYEQKYEQKLVKETKFEQNRDEFQQNQQETY